MKRIGIIILIIGFGLTVYTATTFFTKKKVVEIGTVEITRSKPHYLTWSPLVGIAVMGVGGLLLLRFSKRD